MSLRQATAMVGLLAILATACTRDSTPEPRLYSQVHEIPSVVVSAEHPSATISFGVSAPSGYGPEEMTLRATGSASLQLFRNGDSNYSPSGDIVHYTCGGSDCLGQYEITAEWRGGAPATVDVEYFHALVLLEPPSSSLVTVSDVKIDGGVPVIASGRVTETERDWVAIRAPNGIGDLTRFVLEFEDIDGPEARVVTAAGVEVTDRPIELEMPASCESDQCGTALTIEYNTVLDNGKVPEDRRFEWRILDYNPDGASFRVENQTEWLPTISGIHRVDLGTLEVGDTATRTVTIAIPKRLLETATADRSPSVLLRVSRWAELDLTVAAENSGLGESQVDGIDIEAIHCPELDTCAIDLTFRATRSVEASETAEFELSIEATATLPHLPSVHYPDRLIFRESS